MFNIVLPKSEYYELEETVLWENVGEAAISASTVTLNDSIRNYQFIKVKSKYNTSSAKYTTALMPVEDFLNTKYNVDSNFMFCPVYADVGSDVSARRFAYDTDTTIRFSTASSTSYLVPCVIYGVNILPKNPKLSEIDLYDKILDIGGFVNAGTGNSGAQSFSAVVGKRYLVVANRFSSSSTASDVGISSGATINTIFINNLASYNSRVKLWIAIVTATATTVTMEGTGNLAAVMPLDD